MDYHIHFVSRFGSDELEFSISFHAGGIPTPADSEREPYAEQFMEWFGGFFHNETAFADLHAGFSYPSETRKSRFPLPFKVPILEDLELEVSGVSVTLTPDLDGMTRTEIQLRKHNLAVDLVGGTRTHFKSFNLQTEVDRLSALALRLTERKEQQ